MQDIKNRFRANIKFYIKMGITFLLITYIVYTIDWAIIKTTISEIKLIPFVCSFLILVLSSGPLSLRLQTLLKPTKLKFGFVRLVQVHFISMFYSIILPSGVGASIARWYKITQNQQGRRVFIVITLIERFMMLLTLLLCTGIPLLFVKDERIQLFRSSVLPAIFFLIAVCLIFFSTILQPLVYKKFSLVMKWIQSKFRMNILKKITGIYEDFGLYLGKRDLIGKAFVYHLIFQGIIFLSYYLIFEALSLELPPFTILWISMLVFLLMTIPISFGGFGVRESGFAYCLSLYGIEPEKGIILGGIISIQFILVVGIGAILTIFEKKSASISE